MISTHCDWKAALLQLSLFVSSFIPLLQYFCPFRFGCVFVCVAFVFCSQIPHTYSTFIPLQKKKNLLLLLSLVLFIFCLSCFLYNQMPHLPLIQCPLHNSNYAKSCVSFNISVARHATRCTRHTASHNTVMLILTVKRKPLCSDLIKFTCMLDTIHEEVIFLRKACRLIGC